MKCKCGENYEEDGVCRRGHRLKPLEYILCKIAIRDDKKAVGNVYVGQTIKGYPYTFNDVGTSEEQIMLVPQIGKPVMIVQPKMSGSYIRTSHVKSWCKLGTSNDKLILPKDFPIASLPYSINFEEGDVLFSTLNSIYLAKVCKDQ